MELWATSCRLPEPSAAPEPGALLNDSQELRVLPEGGACCEHSTARHSTSDYSTGTWAVGEIFQEDSR